MQPDSFDDAHRIAWALWVLDHGLPSLPAELLEGQQVPVARWVGSEFGAVLLVGTCPHDPDCGPDLHFATDLIRFRRAGDSWERATASGGTDWHSDGLALPSVRPDHVDFRDSHHGKTRTGWDCLAVSGLVGVAAAWIEVSDGRAVIRQPIEAPAGAFVVALSNARPAAVAILAADGAEIGRKTWP